MRNVPVTLVDPDVVVPNAANWEVLKQLAGGNPEFTAVEIKAFYVVGLISDICEAVEWLLSAKDAWPDKYLPAYSLFASGIDLLGRCLAGNDSSSMKSNLKVGFHYLAKPTSVPPHKELSLEDEKTVVVRTNLGEYSVADLCALRNYSAHGQATSGKELPGLHIELLDKFPELIGSAMEVYWSGLRHEKEYCRRMAIAKLEPYRERAKPLYKVLRYFSVEGNSMASLFNRLDWQVYKSDSQTQ